MATKKPDDKDAKTDKAKDAKSPDPAAVTPEIAMTQELAQELSELTSTQRAAVLMLLLGEQQASEIIRFMNPKEVQSLGAAMVSVSDLSQEAVNIVLDEFVTMLKKQTSLGLGTGDYVEKVLIRALGDDKAASVLSRIMPGPGS
jgi:flagellar motor switch protein FliG